jgi:TRAP transporter 4TM/12TM fusion protein
MKRMGYRPTMSAAIESAASSGAQLVPPVMGTAAFIMAEILGIPYSDVAIAALVPGILYFFAILLQVYLQACKSKLGTGDIEQSPRVRDVLRGSWHLLVGPLFLLYLIIGLDISPGRAAFLAILLVVGIDLLTQLIKTRRLRFDRLIEAMRMGALTGAGIAAATACIGLIIGALDITGMTIRLGATVAELAGDNTLLLLALTGLFCLILGAGLPTLLAYIVVAVTIAPSLMAAGFAPLSAHLFVFYFAIIADITPPVGVTSVVAARIADAPPMRSALRATQISLIAWMIPFYFIYNDAILLMGPVGDIVASIAMVVVGTVLLAIAMIGYCFGNVSAVARLAVGACLATFFVLPTSVLVNLAALAAGIAVLVVDRVWQQRRLAQLSSPG